MVFPLFHASLRMTPHYHHRTKCIFLSSQWKRQKIVNENIERNIRITSKIRDNGKENVCGDIHTHTHNDKIKLSFVNLKLEFYTQENCALFKIVLHFSSSNCKWHAIETYTQHAVKCKNVDEEEDATVTQTQRWLDIYSTVP